MVRSVTWGRAARRENTEGEYSGLEHEVVEDVVESIKARPCNFRAWVENPMSKQKSTRSDAA